MSQKMTGIKALRTFLEADGGRKLTVSEAKQLSKEERDELAQLAAKELGVEIESPKK